MSIDVDKGCTSTFVDTPVQELVPRTFELLRLSPCVLDSAR